ncbi:hypothetical protein V3M68_10525 [Trueperella pyogenes]|uniref:hypothetical protein n=1 Tax=Trueperella pyogenes TaxID=1661 RepID=UPI0024BF32AD|nr:hypothetical protein [Trueperella pyogenes]WHU59063.1 hypothetical protein QEV21_00060 [Trueperella pyogenes]
MVTSLLTQYHRTGEAITDAELADIKSKDAILLSAGNGGTLREGISHELANKVAANTRYEVSANTRYGVERVGAQAQARRKKREGVHCRRHGHGRLR